MRIVDEALLTELRQARVCGWCLMDLRHPPEVHHILGKGAGRVDIRGNLIPLGGPWDCNCHGLVHAGDWASRGELLAATAARDGTTAHAIEAEVWRIRRTPKAGPQPKAISRKPKRQAGPRVAVACAACGARAKVLVADFVRGRSRCACGGLHDRLARAS
jgi:hypothetical protein